jgi:FkbM family methyltransferase
MWLKGIVQNVLKKKNYQLVKHPMKRFLTDHKFDVVFDVGANRGQYATELRKDYGYRGKIVSFEPLSEAYSALANASKSDSNWATKNAALGSEEGENKINVAGNLASSSLLGMLPLHSDSYPYSAYVGQETIKVSTLDNVFDEYCSNANNSLLKIDTQGFELEVLRGGESSLQKVKGLQMELSLSPLYEGGPMAEELIAYVRERGFIPFWFFHGCKDPVRHDLLQIDALFYKP